MIVMSSFDHSSMLCCRATDAALGDSDCCDQRRSTRTGYGNYYRCGNEAPYVHGLVCKRSRMTMSGTSATVLAGQNTARAARNHLEVRRIGDEELDRSIAMCLLVQSRFADA